MSGEPRKRACSYRKKQGTKRGCCEGKFTGKKLKFRESRSSVLHFSLAGLLAEQEESLPWGKSSSCTSCWECKFMLLPMGHAVDRE